MRIGQIIHHTQGRARLLKGDSGAITHACMHDKFISLNADNFQSDLRSGYKFSYGNILLAVQTIILLVTKCGKSLKVLEHVLYILFALRARHIHKYIDINHVW
jgi:hypothetical protein